jgi:two-component system, NarL family, response regulator NreC
MPEAMLRILLVDDHAVVRAGLRLLLEAVDEFEVVDEASDAREAVFKARRHKPDVILLDVLLPGTSGLDAIPELRGEVPEAKLLMLSMEDDAGYVRRAFAQGADGYVVKDAADVELVAAVREVAAGRRYLHPALGAKLVQADIDQRDRDASDPLSEREHAVLRLLALGHTNQEIANTLYISVRTAETHRAHIMQKLSLSTRADLVRYALDWGMLDQADADS